jgi:hypothetical protein
MEIDVEKTLQRRAEALLDRQIRALAREGKPIAAAYRPPTPVKMRLGKWI